jgi:RNA polymerase sigma-70 factor (ECF subfamily)
MAGRIQKLEKTMARDVSNSIRTRRSLLGRLKNWDDQESWQEFFDTYWRLIYGFARKSGLSDAEAQDVVQETVMAVARKMQEFRYDPALGSFKSWLLHTTQWRIRDHYRKRQRLPEAGPLASSTTRTATSERVPDPAEPELQARWDAEWRQNLFDAALERVRRNVDARQFQAFDLYVLRKWPVSKVAQSLGISAGRIYLVKHRIGALLKKEVQRLERTVP